MITVHEPTDPSYYPKFEIDSSIGYVAVRIYHNDDNDLLDLTPKFTRQLAFALIAAADEADKNRNVRKPFVKEEP